MRVGTGLQLTRAILAALICRLDCRKRQWTFRSTNQLCAE
jgi:hypothetical protein